MKLLFSRSLVVFIVFAFSSSIANAQWPIRLDGVPLLADGMPDMNASTPRTIMYNV